MLTHALLAAALCTSQVGDVRLLDFSANWCGPCRQMAPVVEQLRAQGHPIEHVDIDQQPALAAQHRVEGVPTFVLLVDGRERGRLVGRVSAEELLALLRQARDASSASADPAAPQLAPPHRSAGVPATPAGFSFSTPARSAPTPVAAQPTAFDAPSIAPSNTAGPPTTAPLRALEHSPPAMPAAFAGSPPSHPAPPTHTADAALAQRLLAVTVRLRIEDPQGNSYGTGTVIDQRGPDALILTCGHLFRDSQGTGAITIDRFGSTTAQQLPGRLITYDLERDLALVSVRVDGPVATAPVADATLALAPGHTVVSMGCDHGQDPTPRFSHINSLNKYLGPENIQAAGQPVEGRSGGGLFTATGILIGVCHAADPQDDEGLYAAPPSICQLLDAQQFAYVHQRTSATSLAAAPPLSPATPASFSQPSPPAQPVAAVSPASFAQPWESTAAASVASPAPPGMSESPPAFSSAASSSHAASALAAATAAGLTSNEQATLDVLRSQPAGAEVVCIIRRLDDPRAKSEILVLDRASPEFLRQLSRERGAQDARHYTAANRPRAATSPASRRATAQAAPARPAVAASAAADARSADRAAWRPSAADRPLRR